MVTNPGKQPKIPSNFEISTSSLDHAEERAFWMLVTVVERLLPPEMYGASLEGAQVAQEVLWKWLLGENGGRFGVGKVARWVGEMEDDDGQFSGGGGNFLLSGKRRKQQQQNGSGGNGMPPLSLVTTSWFMTVFINVLPIETVLRVWDCFCYQGEKVLMRVTLTLLKIHEDEVLACSDTTDAWRLIKEIPPRMIDAHKLMDICFKPRLTLNLFEHHASEQHQQHQQQYTRSMSRSSSSLKSIDSDEGPNADHLFIQNDPLRKFSENLAKGGAGSGINGGGKVPRRGVGTVSTKMIEHYRALALAERKMGKK
ncbi:hypothetical protein HK100_003062 [Physocladia obscura]|uniref:Rab-GAP TBC domain-containing protein n=1 Tax=Physocladia obscura TaxID=109957 RepID=A0AAD5T7Q2_9FUNG|nr:hypothetical protein HK100_003062 [Physocladia obscura]